MADEEMSEFSDEELNKKVEELQEAVIEKVRTEAETPAVSGGYPGSNSYRPELDRVPSREEILERIGWLREMIDDILKPKPSDFDPLIDKTEKLRDLFGVESHQPGGDSRLRNIDTSKNAIQQWDGAFADNLAEKYFAPLEDVRGNHGRMAKVLNENAIAMKATYVHARGQAKRTLDDGIKAIEAIVDSKGSELKILLAILTGATSLITPLLPSKTAVQLGSAGLSTLLSNLGEAGPEEQEEVPLGADTPEGVMNNVKEALETVKKKRGDDEDAIIKAVNDSETAIYERMTKSTHQTEDDPIYAPRPTIMDSSKPSEGLTKN